MIFILILRMTIPYSHSSATARFFTTFRLLFFRWDGSVWQLTLFELITWFILYLVLHGLYNSDFLVKYTI